MFGEALGEEEERAGIAFVGRTGQFLQRVVTRTPDAEGGRPLDFDRDFWISNIIRCRPPENKLLKQPYTEEALERCRHYMIKTVNELRPKCIVAVGDVALHALTGHRSVTQLGGYVHRTAFGPVIGTFHPSFVVRGNFKYARVLSMDILKAVQVARHGPPERKINYLLDPPVLQAEEWFLRAMREAERLSFDLETPYGAKDEDVWDQAVEDDPSYSILRISFAYKEHDAISVPWAEPYITWSRRLLAQPTTKITWNGLAFDVPRLEAAGCPVEGEHVDGMLLWKMLEPALPMGLKFAGRVMCPDVDAWKLKSDTDPAYYNAADSDIALRIVNRCIKKAKDENKWEMFSRQFVQLVKVLRKMSRRGVNVDKAKRLEARKWLEDMFGAHVASLQPYYPFELRKKKIYKTPLATILKRGKVTEDMLTVVEVEEEIKEGWMLDGNGFLIKKPKLKKPSSKKETGSSASPRKKRKKKLVEDAGENLSLFTESST